MIERLNKRALFESHLPDMLIFVFYHVSLVFSAVNAATRTYDTEQKDAYENFLKEVSFELESVRNPLNGFKNYRYQTFL